MIAALEIVDLLLLVSVVFFLGGYSFFLFRKKRKVGDEPNRTANLIGWSIAMLILVGMVAGLWKLGSPPFSKEGAFALNSHTELAEGDFRPGMLGYQILYYREAIIVDVWSLRLVLPQRVPGGSIFGTAMMSGSFSSGRNSIGNFWSHDIRERLRGSVIDIVWRGDETEEVVTITIDEVVVTIEDGIANVEGVLVPATGPLQVVFFDPLGGVDEVRPRAVEKSLEGETTAPAGDGSTGGG